VLWSCAILTVVLGMGGEASPPARELASPSDLVSVDSSLGKTLRFVLPNGMTVILAPDLEAQVVGMELSYEVGDRDEPDHRPGLASLVQGLMLRGTKHVGSGEYQRLLGGVGGHWTSRTAADRSSFSVTVPSDAIALPLWLWSDQMGFLAETLTDATIAQQIAQVDDGYARRVDDVPRGNTWQMIDHALYPAGHPHHHLADRPGPALRGLTVAEVRAFVARHYAPGRARLVMSGAFDPARARELVARYFAALPAGTPGPRRNGDRPVLAQEIRLRMAAHVDLPSVTIAWATSPEFEADDSGLDAVAQLLTGSRAGLLRIKLVDELKIATEVSAEQRSHQLGSEFSITATAAPGHTAVDLLAAIDGVLRAVKARPPSPDIFLGAVMGYVIQHVFQLQYHATRALLYTHCDEHGFLDSCVQTWLRSYLTLTPAELSRTMVRQLPLDRRVVIEVIPSPDAPLAGENSASAP
jgi:zinc protease